MRGGGDRSTRDFWYDVLIRIVVVPVAVVRWLS